MTFQIHYFPYCDVIKQYQYIAISPDTDLFLHIADDMIDIYNGEASDYYAFPYLATSRSVDFDLGNLNRLVYQLVPILRYDIVAHLGDNRHLRITWLDPVSDKEYEREFTMHDKNAAAVVDEICSMMLVLRANVIDL